MISWFAKLAVAGLMAAWLLFLRPTFLGGPASYIMASGTSMEPTMHTGDLAVLLRQDNYQLGDVVAFQVQGGNVIHRIVGGSAEEGFVMRGDNKNSDDPWKPTPDQVLGTLWLHLPGWGRTLVYLRQPLPLAATLGGLTLMALLGGGQVKRRRKRGRQVASNNSGSSSFGQLPGPAWAVASLGLFIILSIILSAAAIYAFRTPAEKSEQTERLRYEHTVGLGYTALGQPSTLYPEGTVGPVLPPADPETKVAAPPIYTKLARSLELDLSYDLKGSLPPAVSGEMGATLEVRAGENGWAKSQELIAPTPFEGPSATAHASVEIAPVMALIEAIEKETGFSAGTYSLSVLPTVRVSGKVGSQPVDEGYSPAFTIKLSKAQITPEAELRKSEVKKVTDSVVKIQEIGLAGITAPVATVRPAATAGAALFLILSGIMAAYLFLGLGRSERGRVRARYGSMLVSVASADLARAPQRVELATMDDLARLAGKDGQTIFHQTVSADSDLYFVHQGEVVYIYRAGSPAQEA